MQQIQDVSNRNCRSFQFSDNQSAHKLITDIAADLNLCEKRQEQILLLLRELDSKIGTFNIPMDNLTTVLSRFEQRLEKLEDNQR